MLAASFVFLLGCAHTSEKRALFVGEINGEALLTHYQSFQTPYEQSSFSAQEIAVIEQWPDNVHVDVFFGTWCHDSQREVPKLLKILSYNQKVAYKLIALDYQKTEPSGLAAQKAIEFTPTIILYKNNKELGRIIERPRNSLITDMNALITLSK